MPITYLSAYLMKVMPITYLSAYLSGTLTGK
jgi:hypothetical protein